MEFNYITIKIGTYEFQGITDTLILKSKYIEALLSDEKDYIPELPSDLIKNSEQYVLFLNFWKFLHSATKIQIYDEYTYYLITYFNVNLTQAEQESLIELKINTSQCKEIEEFTKEELNIVNNPLHSFQQYIDFIQYECGGYCRFDTYPHFYKTIDEIIEHYSERKNEYFRHSEQEVIQKFIEWKLKNDNSSKYKNILQFHNNLNTLIIGNVGKITFNITFTIRDSELDYYLKNEIHTHYNLNSFKYIDILRLLNKYFIIFSPQFFMTTRKIISKDYSLDIDIHVAINKESLSAKN